MPEGTDFMSDFMAGNIMKQERQPRICDPVSKKQFQSGEYEELMDQVYQNAFSIKRGTEHLKGRKPLCAIINGMNAEMASLSNYTDTTNSKGIL